MAMGDINTIAKQFTEYYYTTFDSNRTNLQPLYRDESMLYWEGQACQGVVNIIEKLTGLPFAKVEHKVSTLDAQPSAPSTGNLMVLVTGSLIVDDSPNPLQFSQCFNLVQADSSYYVLNDIFRLIYG